MGERKVRAPKSIEVIRLRPGQFIGSSETPDHIVKEAIDNFLDELRNGFGNTAGINFTKDGKILVFDNGRGLPLGESIDEESGKKIDSIELIFTKLHSGTKFSIDDDNTSSLFGCNGVGLVAICALSEFVDIRTTNGKEIWHYRFIDGCLKLKEQVDKIRFKTEIIFKPDKRFFEKLEIDKKEIFERLLLAQSKIKDSKFLFNGKQIPQQTLEEFVHKKLELNEDTPLFSLSYKTKIECEGKPRPANIEVYLTYEDGDPRIFGDINLRFSDGSFLNSLQNSIKSILIGKIDKKFEKLPDKYLLDGLRLYASVHHPMPKFDAQTKSRLLTNVRDDLITPIEGKLGKILSEKYILGKVEENLSQKMTAKIIKSGKKRISSDTKLRDCTDKPGDVLFVVEGDSAEAVFRDARCVEKEAKFCVLFKEKLKRLHYGRV